jgi:hypothetical protein
MTPDERLRLDYDHTTDLLRTLTDVRFKLLALVPTVSGTAIGLLGQPRSAAELLGVGLLGLAATFGILLYELRNSELFDYATQRAANLEVGLGVASGLGAGGPGGLFAERPRHAVRLFGITVGHDRGLSLVYGAALAGWSYLVCWGALRALDVGSPRKIGAVVGVCVGALAVGALLRAQVQPAAEARAPRQVSVSGT